MILDIIAAVVFFAGAAFFLVVRLLSLLRFFQQEEYDNLRFLRAANKGRMIGLSRVLLLIGLTVLCAVITLFIPWPLAGVMVLLTGGILGTFGYFEQKLQAQAKKPLVMTSRAQRIYTVSVIISAIIAGAFLFFLRMMAPWFNRFSPAYIPLLGIFLLFIAPYILLVANMALSPYEKKLQAGFVAEAKQRLSALNPQIIGITGSYGKTSTKHILQHILGQLTSVTATPGSVNTEMGITRFIRESLKPEHKIFIAEMGAYGPGSIRKLCDLTPPEAGILTAVGDAHYERFKSLDTVARAKLELYQAVNAKQGPFVIATDMVAPKYLPRDPNLILVGRQPEMIGDRGYLIQDEALGTEGLNMTLISPKSGACEVKAPLYGKHQVTNIACAVALAEVMGFQMQDIAATLKTLPQIRHRLEVIKKDGEPTIIDDAYNSNPHGFEAAIDVLTMLAPRDPGKKGGGPRRIVVTPGMLELGQKHDEEHYIIGQKLAQNVDTVIVIQPERIQALIIGFRSVETSQAHIMSANSFEEAKLWLNENVQPEDVVLYENDLPDLYEMGIAS